MSKKRMIIAPEATTPGLRNFEVGELPEGAIDESNQRKLNRVTERAKFVTLSDEVAKSVFYVRNYKYPEGRLWFGGELEQDQRVVTKYYPHAQGGPLYVSEPRTLYESRKAWEKHKVLTKHGFRHIVIEIGIKNEAGALIPNTSLADALEQLGEL